jgi:hypothetical protein
VNLYGFVENCPINRYDALGLVGLVDSWDPPPYPQHNYCAAYISIVDKILPDNGHDWSKVYTSWYERRFPNTAAFAQETFKKQINDLVSAKLCQGNKISKQDLPSITINGYLNGEHPTPAYHITEANYGDRPQDVEAHWWGTEATMVLGNYSIRVLSAGYRRCGCDQKNGGKRSIDWSARVGVIDTLGVHPTNVQAGDGVDKVLPWFTYYNVATIAGSERDAVIASWNISGHVDCNEKK